MDLSGCHQPRVFDSRPAGVYDTVQVNWGRERAPRRCRAAALTLDRDTRPTFLDVTSFSNKNTFTCHWHVPNGYKYTTVDLQYPSLFSQTHCFRMVIRICIVLLLLFLIFKCSLFCSIHTSIPTFIRFISLCFVFYVIIVLFLHLAQ